MRRYIKFRQSHLFFSLFRQQQAKKRQKSAECLPSDNRFSLRALTKWQFLENFSAKNRLAHRLLLSLRALKKEQQTNFGEKRLQKKYIKY